MLTKPKVFYSKEVHENHPLFQQDWDCVTASLIHCTPLTFTPPKDPYDWIFFSSANGYRFGKSLIKPTSKIAAVGVQTAKSMELDNINFIGSGDIDQVSEEFNALTKGQKVLFVHGNHSIKSVFRNHESSSKNEVEVYSTSLLPKEIPLCDLYFFTSPSNVRSFMEANELPNDAKVIAMGKTTQAFLLTQGITASIPSSFQITHQIEAIKSQLQGY
ncbi:MAG: uroporphyrinogen-III synthase [Bacteroidota bacterium]